MPFCKIHKEIVEANSYLDCGTFDGNCGDCEKYDPRMPTMDDLIPEDWIPTTEGMKWDCVKCGDCCRRDGNFLELTVEECVLGGLNRFFPPRFLEDGYVKVIIMVGSYLSFVDEPKGRQRCIWLGKSECLIYGRRPKTCQIYPFQIYNAIDPEETVYIDSKCKGFGQGRPIYKNGELRPDIWRMKHIVLPRLINELIETVRVGRMLKKAGALKQLPRNGTKTNYEINTQVNLTFLDDDGNEKEYPLLPPAHQIEWKKRLATLEKRHMHRLKAVKETVGVCGNCLEMKKVYPSETGIMQCEECNSKTSTFSSSD